MVLAIWSDIGKKEWEGARKLHWMLQVDPGPDLILDAAAMENANMQSEIWYIYLPHYASIILNAV